MQATQIIISIRPEHVRNIMAGRKTVELRRRFPEALATGVLLIYSSSPEQALVGTARIEQVQRMTPEGLWRRFKDKVCITRDLFDAYFAGANEGFGQGHSKNPSGYSFDGVVAIFPKVLASFGDRETALADHANCGVS